MSHAETAVRQTLRVLALDTEWFSNNGGISTFNRHLCAALAAKGHEVWCEVLDFSQVEEAHASQVGVRLLNAPAMYGESEREALTRRPSLPAGVSPDVLIGHGRITGPAARALAFDHFPNSARLHIVHTSPDETEWYKPHHDRPDDAGERAEDRMTNEIALGRDATRVLAVGPRLYDLYLRELSVFPNAPVVLQLDPGFDVQATTGRRAVAASSRVLILGRLEDARVKGVDIAARALAYAADRLGLAESELEVVLRGVPSGQSVTFREYFLTAAGRRPLRVSTRRFSIDVEELQRDQHKASLVLLPSRAEGFGLVGVEAITIGTPVLISGRSGLGMLLRKLVPDLVAQVVLNVDDDPARDKEVWGQAVANVLRDPAAAFARAEQLRREMAGRRSWAMAADVLLDALGLPGLPATPLMTAENPAHQGTHERLIHSALPISRSAPTTLPRYSGRVKWQFYQRLAGSWKALADVLGIQSFEQTGFVPPQGREIWEWLEVRMRLDDLRSALIEIDRLDLVTLLDTDE